MNQFGGNWTESKMQIILDYAKAYLTIMNKQPWAKTIYFDGFAGSGTIQSGNKSETSIGTALRILALNNPKPFDIYYFVELNETNKKQLESKVQENYSGKVVHIVKADCNDKLRDMAEYLKANRNFRALAFIDPYGMTVKWSSLEALKGLGLDLWILVPTGIGVNRLLKKNGDISEAWLAKLEFFLGISKQRILEIFYDNKTVPTLFGEETIIEKEKKAIIKIGKVYSGRLKEIFNFVSEPFILKNSQNSILYHFMMATNNNIALKVANEVISPKYKM
ncbi:MAG: three-Cys-motif partner protein TcmP [Chitinophagaceae bacterium]